MNKIKMTAKREEILSYLQKTSRPLSASAIHSALPQIDLVTIYRNLELFTDTGLIKKLLISSNEALFEYQSVPHHHAVCTNCHKVIHFSAPDEKIVKLFGLTGFDVSEIEMTVRGTCKH